MIYREKIGREDINYGSGTFDRKSRTGFDIELTKVIDPSIEHNNDGTHKDINADSLKVKNSPWVDPTHADFGAVGDGASESADTTGINAAIDYLETLGGGILRLPLGHFKYSGNIATNKRIRIVGTNPGKMSRTYTSDATNVTRLDLTGTGVGIRFYAASNDPDVRGASVGVQDMLLYAGAGITRAIDLEHIDAMILLERIWMAVHASAVNCYGIHMEDSWFGRLNDIMLFHLDNAYASTLPGLNITSTSPGGDAVNQLILSNVHSRFFNMGVKVAGAANLNSIVILGGAAEYNGTYGLYVGAGVQGLSAKGFHIENAQDTGLYVHADARNVSYTDAKLVNNANYDIYADGQNFKLENLYHGAVENVAIHCGANAKYGSIDHITAYADGYVAKTNAFTSDASTAAEITLGHNLKFGTANFTTPIGNAAKWRRPRRSSVVTTTTTGTDIAIDASNADAFELSHASATNVKTLTNGHHGQMVVLKFTNANTTVTHSSIANGIILAGGKDFSGRAYHTITLWFDGTYWIEIARQQKTPDSVSADKGDAAATLTIGTSEQTNVWNTPLTAGRAVTLSTTVAYNGAKFRIRRTAAATGAFNLNVGTGPLKALGIGAWCDVVYNGSAWELDAYGTL